MDQTAARVKRDFDRIAVLPDAGWDHNRHYHPFILSQLPARMRNALDVGCGKGDLTRKLAARTEQVLGIDFSSGMIEQAKIASAGLLNVAFIPDDFHTWPGPKDEMDAIVSVATLHHLEPKVFAERAKSLLRPGGTLVVVDLCRDEGSLDMLRSATALALSNVLRLWKTLQIRHDELSRKVWEEHAEVDHFLSIGEARLLWSEFLPGAVVRCHLFWRYSVIWKKPTG